MNANVQQRLISALILAPLAIGGVYAGGWAYIAVILGVAACGLREWVAMFRNRPGVGGMTVWAGGLLYMGGFAAAMIWLRGPYDDLDDNDAVISITEVLYVLTTVWATDIGAYVAGRLIGGPRLAPAISPNKTWAGLVGGVALAGLCGWLDPFRLCCLGGPMAGSPGLIVALAVFMAIVSQMGDLFESAVKRFCGVKDSGALIPGHGGILDRIDGLVFAAVFLVLFDIVFIKVKGLLP